MKQIAMEKGILMYYGNRAGYAEGRKCLCGSDVSGHELKKVSGEQKENPGSTMDSWIILTGLPWEKADAA